MPPISKESVILRAAEQLFASRRFHEVTMDDVCHAAGVGKGTIYRYFKDKDELFFRMAISGSDELCELIRARAADGLPFEEQLLHILIDMHALIARRRELFRLLQSEEARLSALGGALRTQWMTRRHEMVAGIAHIFEKAIKDGRARSDLSPEVLASCMLGMFRGFAWQSGGKPNIESTRQFIDLFLHGAGKNGASDSEKTP